MSFEEIEKLKDRLARDPAAKLFLPLSEEYRKAGMLDEAIEVLRRGLETHPSYMSARVALGKIYHEKGMLKEAIDELEKVTRAIPDNLFAHRKLAEIYRETGEAEKASKEFEAVLGLNPLDDEARAHVERPAAREKEHFTEAGGAVEAEPPQGVFDEPPEPETVLMEAVEADEAFVPPPEASPEDYEEFAKAMNLDFRPDGEVPPGEEGVTEVPPPGETGEGLVVPEFGGAEAPGEVAGEPGPPLECGTPGETVLEGLMRAEDLIARDEFTSAFSAYRELLRRYPSDRRVLQKVEELRSYLGMIGRGREEVISKMESFVDGIRRRKDEFLRSA